MCKRFIVGLTCLLLVSAAQAVEKPIQWFGTVGGDWSFLQDDGAPLHGKDWQEFRYGFGFQKPQSYSLYLNHRILGRTDKFDHIFGAESYLSLFAPVTFRLALAGSPDHDFAYQWRTDAEAEVQIGRLAVGGGYWFMDYPTTNIHILTPFVRMSLPNTELSLRYLNIFDTAPDKHFHAFSIQSDFSTPYQQFQPFVSFVYGKRLIGVLSPAESPGQTGFIAMVGNKFTLSNRVQLKCGVSYGKEESLVHYTGVFADMKVSF